MSRRAAASTKISRTCYSAAGTECDSLITCCHRHRTIAAATACIRGAAAYIVAVEGRTMRCLTEEEEAKFQQGVQARCAKAAQPVSSNATATARRQLPRRAEGETLVDFALRFLRANGIDGHKQLF
jgi:hypothetical protein